MANEIWKTYRDGSTMYALIWRKTDDKVYDAVAGADTFDTYADADIDDYDVPMAEAGTTGDYYSVDFPAGISAGVYRVQAVIQAGANPDDDDDLPIGEGEIYWDGTAEINLYIINSDVEAIKANLGQVHTVEDESPGGGGGAATTSGIAEGC